MNIKIDYDSVIVQLREYFQNTKVPKTINSAIKELGIRSTNVSPMVKILREKFPDEMNDINNMYYCMPASSNGSIVTGYFLVKYKDDIMRYIDNNLGVDEIYDNLMKDPRNKSIKISKQRFMEHFYHFVRRGGYDSLEIKKAFKERTLSRINRLSEIYKDVMTSEPFKYDIPTLCKKYKISRSMVYRFIKHDVRGKKLKQRLIYNVDTNCE